MNTNENRVEIKIKTKIILATILLISVFLVSCTQSQQYQAYNQQQGQAQNTIAGGGCGVAPSENYADTPVKALNPTDLGL